MIRPAGDQPRMIVGERGASPGRICFVSPSQHWLRPGGAEIAIKYLAEHLAARGWAVRFVCAGAAETEGTAPSGAPVFYYRKASRWGLGDGPSMMRALRRADADVYYQRVTSVLTLVTGLFCRRASRMMIWAAAHNRDCAPFRHVREVFRRGRGARYSWKGIGPVLLKRLIVDLAYPLGIYLADVRLAHMEEQQRLLRRAMFLQSELLYKGYPCERVRVNHDGQAPDGRQIVVWIANLRSWKRPEIFVRLAARLAAPDREFRMIGAPFRDAGAQEAFERSVADVPGLRYVGELSHEEVLNQLAGASLLVHTSEVEGFANVFIEAWMNGTPVVTKDFNPDDVIERYGVGGVAETFDELVDLCSDYLSGRRSTAGAGFERVVDLFDMDRHCDRLESIMVQRTGRARRTALPSRE